MQPEPGEEVIFRGHPSWRSILGFYFKGLLVAAVAGGIALAAGTASAGAIGIGLAVFAVVLGIGLIRRISTLYVVSTERLHIRRGIFSRHTQETRIDRVQNVNTNQSILERLLQVGTVDFDTAGSDDYDFAFRGVAEPEEVVRAVDRAQRVAREHPHAPAQS